MKKIIITTLLFAGAFFTSCDSDSVTTGGVSRITEYPIVTINGDALVVINQGSTYNDEGAIALAGTTELDVATEGSVNTAVPGVYKIMYSAENSDGFSSGQTRTIIVLSSAPSAINLEGTFFRNGNPNQVVRLSERVYTADNAGGLASSPANDPNFLFVTFYAYDDTHVYIPLQMTPSGISVESVSGDIVSNDNFKWVLSASAFYGSALRNFVR